MGKKQHQSDKLYLTSTEWSTLYGGMKVTKQDADKAEFRRLPFDACSLTLQVIACPDSELYLKEGLQCVRVYTLYSCLKNPLVYVLLTEIRYLTPQPFENPLCTEDGCIFDLMNIVPFLKKYGRHPVTGEKLDAKSLIRLNFKKNSADKYHCPGEEMNDTVLHILNFPKYYSGVMNRIIAFFSHVHRFQQKHLHRRH